MSERSVFRLYWSAYGGWKALYKSLYLRFSLALTAVMYPTWSNPNWWSDVLNITPNLLGFSLGGFAMWLALGDEGFKSLIAGKSDTSDTSPYMAINAAFVHFIIIQIIAILLALACKNFYVPIEESSFLFQYLYIISSVSVFIYAISYFFFIYAVVSALAATFALLRGANWYDMDQTEKNSKK